MATSSVEINKKRCMKCNGTKSGGGIFTCDGCQQMFCARHVSEHRQELSLQLENAMQEHDFIQQETNRITPDEDILRKIDTWEKESILKIQKIAETSRIYLNQWYQNTNSRIKIECIELAKNLRTARESDDFAEPDLLKWNQMLSNLREQLDSMTKISIIEDKQSSINYIKINHDTHRSTNASVHRSVRRNDLYENNNRPTANRQEEPVLTNSSRSTRPKRIESNGTRAIPSECKQQ